MRARRQRWLAVSKHGRDVLVRRLGLPSGAIDVVRNGVPPSSVAALSSSERDHIRATVRRETGLATDSRIVLSVGRLDGQKAHADLIAAVGPILRAHPDLHVLIAGDGPERSSLADLAAEVDPGGRLKLLGRRDDVPRLIAASDLFAFPSHFEGLPFALAEAMAGGCPVVAARFPGADELIRDGTDGLLVPVGNTAALRTALERALENPAATAVMARAAQDRVSAFTEQRMVERTMSFLEESAVPHQPETV
jgi:glycosyltransferase involved in cell wall biosynthesis